MMRYSTTLRCFFLSLWLVHESYVVVAFPSQVRNRAASALPDVRPSAAIEPMSDAMPAVNKATSAILLPSNSILTRREAGRHVQGLLVASTLLATNTGASASAVTAPRTIVITGANSGIGYEACRRLAQQDGLTVVLACRTLAKAQEAIARLMTASVPTRTTRWIPAACDLADLQSIQSFVSNVPTLLSKSKIDALCLNAGIARNTAATECARTKDGFELTVGINHFGHFYLTQLLLSQQAMAPTSSIVVTASSVHDPASPGGSQGATATLGQLQGLERLGNACEMVDGAAFNADKAYKDSKLCNVLFTKELQRRLETNAATKDMTVNCFSPGLIVGSGLFRDQNPVFTKLFDIAATNLLKVGETPEWGGASLAYMATTVARDSTARGLFFNSAPGSSKYGDAAFGDQFAPRPVSVEAQDEAKAKRLYDLSLQVLDLN